MKRPSTVLVKDSIDTIAIGSFDGIHLGHQQLIDRLGEHGALFVIDKDCANLTPGVKRAEYSKHPCMFYHFLKVKELSGGEFIELLKKEFINLKRIVVGYDFLFGKRRSCDTDDLRELFDGEVEVVDEFLYGGVSVHSSLIREAIKNEDIEKANRFLGREYSITGAVVKGQGLGQAQLYPTINIKTKCFLLPSDGVYATRTMINEKIYDSVSFLGNRVSTDQQYSIETHVLDDSVEVKSSIELFFVQYLRANRKFNDLTELKAQIATDIKSAKSALSVCKVYPRG